MRPQHPADGTNHIPDPALRALFYLACWYTLLGVALIFLMICVAGAVEALGYR